MKTGNHAGFQSLRVIGFSFLLSSSSLVLCPLLYSFSLSHLLFPRFFSFFVGNVENPRHSLHSNNFNEQQPMHVWFGSIWLDMATISPKVNEMSTIPNNHKKVSVQLFRKSPAFRERAQS